MFACGAVVVSERLFVYIAKQVERLNADVGSTQAALQQTPEVFQTVRVNLSAHVLFGVVDDFVNVLVIESKYAPSSSVNTSEPSSMEVKMCP